MAKVEVTKEQIEDWKKEHGDVFQINSGDKIGFVRRPSRHDLSYASIASNGSDSMKYNEAILTNCWLGGDEEIKTEDKYFLGAIDVLDQIIEKEQGEIKKL